MAYVRSVQSIFVIHRLLCRISPPISGLSGEGAKDQNVFPLMDQTDLLHRPLDPWVTGRIHRRSHFIPRLVALTPETNRGDFSLGEKRITHILDPQAPLWN